MIKETIILVLQKMGYKLLRSAVYEELIKTGNKPKNEYGKFNLLEAFFINLRELNFQPLVIYDIGAHKGTWSKQCLRFFPVASYFLFEPQQELMEDIRKNVGEGPNIRIYSLGIGDTDTTLNFTLHNRKDSRSFKYSNVEADRFGYKQIPLPIARLDTLIEKEQLPVPDILKIDAEGLDIKVINGAGKYLNGVEVILVEVGVMNKNIPNSVRNMVNLLDEKGFLLFDITEMNRPFKNKVLWLCELVFVKKNGKLDKNYSETKI